MKTEKEKKFKVKIPNLSKEQIEDLIVDCLDTKCFLNDRKKVAKKRGEVSDIETLLAWTEDFEEALKIELKKRK